MLVHPLRRQCVWMRMLSLYEAGTCHSPFEQREFVQQKKRAEKEEMVLARLVLT